MNDNKMPVYRKLYITGGVVLLIVALLTMPFIIPMIKGHKTLRIESPSMEPTYPVGGLVYVAPVEDYTELHVDDVISFRTDSGTAMLTTHRIVEITADGMYITKGDNNNDRDINPVSFERIEGKVVLGISSLGYIAPLFQTVMGKIFLIILVAFAVGLWILGDYTKKQMIKNGSITTEEKKVKKDGPQFKHDYISWGLVCIGVGLICFGGSKLIDINLDNKDSKELYNNIESQYVEVADNATINADDPNNVNSHDLPDGTFVEWYNLVKVDVAKLQEFNSDVVGWLYFEDGNISYPIMYSGDNITYYRHNISHKYDSNGAIFIEAGNKSDLSDSNTFIYGHNMRSLAMFGKLKYYRLEDGYYETHQYYQIITADKVLRYRIFAYEEVKEDSSLFSIYREDSEAFATYLQAISEQSYIHPDFEVTSSDKVITMVTCNGVDGERFLVHAVLDEVHEIK